MTQSLVSLLPFAVLAFLWVVFVGRLQRRQANGSRVEQPESHAESREPRDVWGLSGAIHTYRDADVPEGSAALAVGGLILGLLLLLPVAMLAFAKGFSLADRGEGALGLALVVALAYLSHRRHRYGRCREIRLSDDGTCELETRRRVIPLHANQIESVKYVRDPDSQADYYIRYRGGSVPVTKGMTSFADFLTRLKTLNPSVKLIGFPADAWPGLGDAATKERGDRVRVFRNALFPLIVISLLVYLASQTFLGK